MGKGGGPTLVWMVEFLVEVLDESFQTVSSIILIVLKMSITRQCSFFIALFFANIIFHSSFRL